MKLAHAPLACVLAAVGCGGGHIEGGGGGGRAGGAAGAQTTPRDAGTPPESGAAGAAGAAGVMEPAPVGGASGASPLVDAAAPPRETGDAAFDSSAADPGTDGDGIRMLAGPYHQAPEYSRQAGVPQGKVFHFMMGVASTIYPKAPTTRNIGVYVPEQYKAGAPAAVIVVQDGTDFYGFDSSIPTVLDNLIARGAIPPLIGVFAGNGGGDYIGSERGLEYDTVSGLYAQWASSELLPRVEDASKVQVPAQAVTFTKDPEGRATLGGSSGGAAAFSMAWWHPDLFRRVITFSGTFVDQVAPMTPFPNGCWVYHDEDPYDATGPNGLIVAHCESSVHPEIGSDNPGACDTPLTQATCEAAAGCAWNTVINKPLRAWLESGSNDDGAGDSPSGHRNFDLASQRMAAALQRRGYHFHYDHAQGAGHVDQGPLRQTLPEALTWLWRGYRASGP
jgi:enterochelin esterase family protein